MRFLLFALGVLGAYQFLRQRRARRRQPALLSDMRGRWRPRPSGRVTYEIVEHDGGWAYKVDDVFSETYATRPEAVAAAGRAAKAHQSAGEAAFIEYQDTEGRWHEEVEPGDDRPEARVAGANGGRQGRR